MATRDDFNRATFDNGNWSAVAGSMWVTNGSATARPVSLSSLSIVRRAAAAFPNDQYAQCRCEWVSYGGGNSYGGIGVRLDGSGNGYFARVTSGGIVELRKIVAGVNTFLGDYSAGVGSNSLIELKLVATGTSIQLYISGFLQISVTDASIASGKPGMQGYAETTGTQPDADDFECTDATGSAAGEGDFKFFAFRNWKQA